MVNSDKIDEKVEKGILKSENRINEILLGDLLNYSSQPFGVEYPDGSLGIVNKAFEELTGYTQKELKNSNWSETLTPPEFHDMEQEKLGELQRTGQPIKYEKEYIRKDGTRIPIELLVHLVRNEDGSPKYYYSFITDITERKEREMLSDALNKLNSYINSTRDYKEIMQLIVEEGAKTLDTESSVINLIEGNNWVVKFAYNFPNKIIGQKKTDEESPTSMYVAKEKKAVAFNDAMTDSRVNKNGMKLHGVNSLLVAPIILNNEVKGIIAFYHHQKSVIFSEAQIDFANKLASSLSQAVENAQLFGEIKKSEDDLKRHAALLDVSYEAIFSYDYGGGIVSWNQGAERLYGYTSNEAIGSISYDLLKTTFPIKFNEFMEILINDKMWTGELTHTTKNGEQIIVESRQQLIQDSLGRDIVIETNRDITERKKAEMDLRDNEEKYRNLFENMTEGFVLGKTIFDENGRPIDHIFLEANNAFIHQTGIKKEVILNKPITEAIPGIERDPANWIEVYGAVAKTGAPVTFENYAQHEKKWYSLHVYSPKPNHFKRYFYLP